MNDIVPPDGQHWLWLENTLATLLAAYGYQNIRTPIVERTELFKRSIGEATDIVEKEMYTFADRNDENLTLRPEATAGLVRAAITHGLTHNQKQKLWTTGPMFRYERPQKGRYRQFHQINVEAFGYEGPDIDIEMLAMTARLWRQLGITRVKLEINSLGTPAARAAYRTLLVDYFSAHADALDEDSQRRLGSNPMRILDSKNQAMADLIAGAPVLTEHLDAESEDHFAALRAGLDALGIHYTVNPRLVRGLDYYSRTVFEWITDALGAQGAVCSGGRYDGLFEQLGGKPVPGIGWAIGVERLLGVLDVEQRLPEAVSADIYLVAAGAGTEAVARRVAEQLRDEMPAVRIIQHLGGGGMKSQLRQADRSGAAVAVIIGEQEVADGVALVKPLRGGEQTQVAENEVMAAVAPLVSATGRSVAGK